MASGNTTYDVYFPGDQSTAYGLYAWDLIFMADQGYDYQILAYHEQVEVTVIDFQGDSDQLQNVLASTPLIPEGNNVDLTFEVPVWYVIAKGMSAKQILDSGGITQGFEDAGLTINSVEESFWRNTAVLHCTATKTVNTITPIITPQQQVMEAGNGAIIIAIVAGLIVLGIIATVIVFRVTSTQMKTVEFETKLAGAMAEEGYSAQEIQDTINAINKGLKITGTPLGIDFEQIFKYAAYGILAVGAIMIIPKLIPQRTQKSSMSQSLALARR